MPVQGHQWPKPLTVAQPEIQAGWKAFHHQAHSQPPTLTLGPHGQATPPQVHVGGVGGSQSTGRRHADVGRMCKLHPERGPARNDFVFSLIILRTKEHGMKQHYSRTCYSYKGYFGGN